MDIKAIREQLRAPAKVAAHEPARRSWTRITWISLAVLLSLPIAAVVTFYAAALLRESHTSAELAPPTGRFVQTSRGHLFVQEKGPSDGQPVILIHGTAAWSELWRETIDHLANSSFRVVAIDLPPFGFSDRPADRDYSRAMQAERIAALIDALALGPTILVGHSFGAGPTVETVMKVPEKIRGLVLVDGALGISEPDGPTGPPRLVSMLLSAQMVRDPLVAASVTNPLFTKALVQTMVHRKEAVTDKRVTVLQQPMKLRNSTADLGDWLNYFTSVDSKARSMDRASYKDITTKTILIWGDQDTLTPLAQAHDIAGLIAGSELMLLPGLGHIPQIEDPAIFVQALVAALRRLQ